jgi:PAS domain S-box-containing protein
VIERVPERGTRPDTFRALHEIAVAAGGMLEPEALADFVVDRVRVLLAVEGSVLRWWEPEAGVMRLLAHRQPHPVPLEITPDNGIIGRVFTTRRPVRVNDYVNWPHAAEWAIRDGAKAALFVPLLIREQPVGVLGVISYEQRIFSEEDELVLTLLAAQVAPALETARLHAEVERRGRRQEILAGLGRLALSGHSVGELLEEGVRLVLANLPCEEARVLAQPPPGWVSVAIGAEGNPSGRLAIKPSTRLSADDLAFLNQIGNVLAEGVARRDLESRMRSAEAVNRESAELLRQVIDALMTTLIQVRDVDGNFLIVNRAYADLFDTTSEEMQGRNIADLMVPSDVRRMKAEDSRVLRTWKPIFNPESTFHTKDGRSFQIAYWQIPFRTAAGKPAVLVVSHDLRDHKRAEQAREESEAKSRFLATMSHELRTPLNSVLGFAQLLQQESFGELNERQQRYVDHILSGGRHLLELINDVLDLSKVQSGRMELKPVELAVAQVLREAKAKAQPLAAERGLVLRVQAAPGLQIRADRRRLDQVLWNLLSNAIRFTPEGGTVTLRSRTDADQVVIDVIDTGLGIAPEMHDRIFEEFTQVDSGSRRAQDGTGLGLALTRSLLKLMGGTISVESELGKGSTFSARLPAA